MAKLLINVFYPTGTIPLDLDDTLFHRTGRKVASAGWWRDAVLSTGKKVVHCWGLNLVVLTLHVTPPWGDEPLGLPINMRVHRKDGDSLIDLAQQMLLEFVNWFPERLFHACADGFYASVAGRDLPQIHLTSRMRRDAAIYDLPQRQKKGKRGPKPKKGRRLPAPRELAKRVKSWRRVETQERGKKRVRLIYTKVVIWYKVSQKPVLLVISRDPEGKEKDDFFFSTDVELTGADVVSIFAGRWSIEGTFKNTKQYIGAQEPQTWKHKGSERAAMVSLWLYSVVWAWYIQHGYRKSSLLVKPWFPSKERPSFQDALACLRRVLWRKRIISMFEKHAVSAKISEYLIEALASAA